MRPVSKPPFARCQQSSTASPLYARLSQTRNHSAQARTRYLKTRVSSSSVETKRKSQGLFLVFPPFISLILGDAVRWIDLSNPTSPKLQALLEACDPVLKDDATHPKAWKLENPNFSTRFDVLDAGIVEHVRSKLAKGGFVPLERVRAELRQLNVHGEYFRFGCNSDLWAHFVVEAPDRSSSQTNTTPHQTHLAYSSSCSLPRMKAAPSISDVKTANGRSTHPLLPPPPQLNTSRSTMPSNTNYSPSPLGIVFL